MLHLRFESPKLFGWTFFIDTASVTRSEKFLDWMRDTDGDIFVWLGNTEILFSKVIKHEEGTHDGQADTDEGGSLH